MKKLAIFASGTGTNTAKIIEHFKENKTIIVAVVVSNKSSAGVLRITETNNIATLILQKETFFQGNGYVNELKSAGIDIIVLAGFLWQLPVSLIRAFPKKIINIHPALLPKFGGKGMYGNHVHEAVLASGEKESGISIHFVDEQYDHGQIIMQAKCSINKNDDVHSLANKIHQLEHRHFSPTIEVISTL